MYQIRNLTLGSMSLTVEGGDNISLPPNGETFVPTLTGEMLSMYPRILNINPPPRLDGTEVNDPQLVDVDALVAEALFFRDYRQPGATLAGFSQQSAGALPPIIPNQGVSVRDYTAYPQDYLICPLNNKTDMSKRTILTISQVTDPNPLPTVTGTFYTATRAITSAISDHGYSVFFEQTCGGKSGTLLPQGKLYRVAYMYGNAVFTETHLGAVGTINFSWDECAAGANIVGDKVIGDACFIHTVDTGGVGRLDITSSYGITRAQVDTTGELPIAIGQARIEIYGANYATATSPNGYFPSTHPIGCVGVQGVWERVLKDAERAALVARFYG